MRKYIIFLSISLCVGICSAQVSPEEKAALLDFYNATGGPSWISENDDDPNNNWDFSGPVTSDWEGISLFGGHVDVIDLRYNNLSGTLPTTIGNLIHLTSLVISSNRLTGPIPSEIGNLSKLFVLYLTDSGLTGEIPKILGSLTNLHVLRLYLNQLEGEIPEELGNLINLRKLSLSGNNFTGSIPSTFSNFTELEFITFQNNRLSGTIPDFSNNLNITNIPIFNNYYQHGDFENQIGLATEAALSYSHQLNVPTIRAADSNTIQLSVMVKGSQNNYQWYKNGTEINSDATNDVYTLPNGPEASGNYFCKITSDIVPDLIIESEPVSIETTSDGTPLFLSGDNYVYQRTYQTKYINTPDQKFRKDDGYVQEIDYFDGLGRLVQKNAIRQSPNRKDIVSHTDYDAFGRVDKEWLPIPKDGEINGIFRHGDWKSKSKNFYKEKYPQDFDGIPVTEINPYSEKLFEPSPLNRIKKQGAPGKDWKISNTEDDHSIEFDYQTNTANEVRLFRVRFNANGNGVAGTESPILAEGSTFYYGSKELTKRVVKDENHTGNTKNHTTEEFTDRQGRIVLKRTYSDIQEADGSVVQAAPHDTYYVYDDFGNLTYVMPPLMEANTTSLTNLEAAMPHLGYQYSYDNRNRVVQKWIPGKEDWDYVVYNTLDQPILSQDPNLRIKNQWLFTKYDVFGRVSYTGLVSTTKSRLQLQEDANAQAGPLWESRTDSPISLGDGDLYYTNATLPSTNIIAIHTVHYFDHYDNLALPSNLPSNITVFGSNPSEAPTLETHGLPTYTQVRVLDVSGPNNWIHSLTYYDKKGRAVYGYTQNDYLGTIDIIESELDFLGKPLKTKNSHIRNGNTIVTIDNFTYDHVGRLLSQTQCIGDETLGNSCASQSTDGGTVQNLIIDGEIINNLRTAGNRIQASNSNIIAGGRLRIDGGSTGTGSAEELIAENTYDALGQLVLKKVGGATTGNGLQQVDYTYNVRGWLKAINDVNTTDKLFNFKIIYNDPSNGATPLFNGNISETQWRTANSDNSSLKYYNYAYDALNRIINAIDNTGDLRYSLTNITYDKNGNIQKLKRNGHLVDMPNGSDDFGVMDDLTYSYTGNQLKTVDDDIASSAAQGFVDGVELAIEYTYDDNGNMISDANKEIADIEYNYLNLPTRVEIGAGVIRYMYDATGTKLKKIVSTGTITDYAGGYIYENGTLQFFNHAAGYVNVQNGPYEYVYQYSDHLGNVRLSYADADGDGSIDAATEIIEENNYYPFGLSLKGYNNHVSPLGNSTAQKWKYNGMEHDESLGLEIYDFGARNYDPALGRWMNLDPLAEMMRRHSPYSYAFDNPVFFIDPDGMMPQNNNAVANDPEYDVTDEYGNEARMGRSELLDYISANGTTDDFDWSSMFYELNEKYGDGGCCGKKKSKTKYPVSIDTDDIMEASMAIAASISKVDGSLKYADGVAGAYLVNTLLGIVLAKWTADQLNDGQDAILMAYDANWLYAKQERDIQRLLTKEGGPPGFTYALTVNVSGTYQSVRGDLVELKAGDVWKYGKTTMDNRYTQKELTNKIPGGVTVRPLFFGNNIQIRIQEKIMIYGHALSTGKLPPGNHRFY